jgi:DNA-binding transcriptional ArsR family regulator
MDTVDDRLDLLLRALADTTRRSLLDRLRDAPGLTLGELIQGLPQTRQALSKHLAVLEDAGLVVPVWRGREKRHYLDPVPLQQLPSRWVTASAGEDAAAATRLHEALGPMPESPRPAAPAPSVLASRSTRRKLDPIAARLLAPPSTWLRGQPILHLDALAAAREYLADTGEAVQALLVEMQADAGYQRPAAGGFSLVEHLAHLADIETLGWRVRFTRILEETRPPRLAGVDGDRLAVEKRYQERPWRGAARRFVAERRKSLALLQKFDADVLRRQVVFAGARTRAGGVVAAAVAHDLDHRPAMAEAWLLMRKSAP